MKRNLIIVLVSVLLAGCGAVKNLTNSSNSNTSSSSPSAKPVVGDTVVAKSGNWYAEGKIRIIDGPKANITWLQKDREASDIDLSNVYPLPKPGAQPAVKVNDFVIAKTSTYSDNTEWDHVQITKVTNDVITVKDRNNTTFNLSPDKVIAVSPADAADLKGEFEKNDKENEFDKKAQAVQPTAPSGYKPKVGETVVAPSTTNIWFIGPIKSITGDKATILWDAKNNQTFDTTLDKIIPKPSGATLPAVNDYILIKNTGCDNCQLLYTQVTAVNGANIEVKDRYDSKFTTKPGDFLALK